MISKSYKKTNTQITSTINTKGRDGGQKREETERKILRITENKFDRTIDIKHQEINTLKQPRFNPFWKISRNLHSPRSGTTLSINGTFFLRQT